MKTKTRIFVLFALSLAAVSACAAQNELAPGSAQLVSPEELASILLSPRAGKPLILNVGPRLLFEQAHIPGAEHVGAGSDSAGLESLRNRVKPLSHDAAIVLYCGCCPWSHCPNIRPAFDALHALGFSHVKVLYIADNFGTNWVDKGYPTVRGH